MFQSLHHSCGPLLGFLLSVRASCTGEPTTGHGTPDQFCKHHIEGKDRFLDLLLPSCLCDTVDSRPLLLQGHTADICSACSPGPCRGRVGNSKQSLFLTSRNQSLRFHRVIPAKVQVFTLPLLDLRGSHQPMSTV